jgi:peptidoglycan hydrolase-like protein with peptidoglycan-binding domain
MRNQLSTATLAGLVVVAVAGCILLVPSATAQSTTHKKTNHSTKTSATAKSGSTTNHSASTHTNSSTKSTAKTASSKSTTKSTKGSGKKSAAVKKVKGQATPAPERITEIQDELAKRGAFIGSSSGKLDDSTSDALRKFQSANHLTPTGKIDALTLQKLGLGSETAGLAAPTPPPNSAVNRLLSRPAHPDPNDNN